MKIGGQNGADSLKMSSHLIKLQKLFFISR